MLTISLQHRPVHLSPPEGTQRVMTLNDYMVYVYKAFTLGFLHLLKVCWPTMKLQTTPSLLRPRAKPFPLRTISKDSVECKQTADKLGGGILKVFAFLLMASHMTLHYQH